MIVGRWLRNGSIIPRALAVQGERVGDNTKSMAQCRRGDSVRDLVVAPYHPALGTSPMGVKAIGSTSVTRTADGSGAGARVRSEARDPAWEVAAMTAEKEGQPGRRKGSAGRAKREPPEPGSQEGSGQDRGMAIVDPWGALLEQLLEVPAEDGTANEHGGKRK